MSQVVWGDSSLVGRIKSRRPAEPVVDVVIADLGRRGPSEEAGSSHTYIATARGISLLPGLPRGIRDAAGDVAAGPERSNVDAASTIAGRCTNTFSHDRT
jgi:hypothetical protein